MYIFDSFDRNKKMVNLYFKDGEKNLSAFVLKKNLFSTNIFAICSASCAIRKHYRYSTRVYTKYSPPIGKKMSICQKKNSNLKYFTHCGSKELIRHTRSQKRSLELSGAQYKSLMKIIKNCFSKDYNQTT